MGKERRRLYFFVYYPIGVEADGHEQPRLTWLLMFAMVAVFTYFKLNPFQALVQWGWWIYFPRDGLTPGLLLAPFNHGNWVHLGGNLLYLWAFGPSLEAALGRRRFLLVFLFLGITGNLIQGGLAGIWMVHLAGYGIVGASGAISGLMGIFLVRFPYARIRTAWLVVSPLHGKMKSGIVAVPSHLAIAVWIAFQVLAISLRLIGVGADSTAYGAHLGGFLCGIGLAYGFGCQREGRRLQWRHRAERRLAKGEWLGAFEAVQALLVSSSPEDLTLAARTCRLVGHARQSQDLYRRAALAALGQGDAAGGAAVYAEALRVAPGLPLPEDELYRVALALERIGRPSEALAAIRAYRALHPHSARLGFLLLRGARLEAEIDPDAASEFYREHIRRFPESPFTGMVQGALRQLEGA